MMQASINCRTDRAVWTVCMQEGNL